MKKKTLGFILGLVFPLLLYAQSLPSQEKAAPETRGDILTRVYVYQNDKPLDIKNADYTVRLSPLVLQYTNSARGQNVKELLAQTEITSDDRIACGYFIMKRGELAFISVPRTAIYGFKVITAYEGEFPLPEREMLSLAVVNTLEIDGNFPAILCRAQGYVQSPYNATIEEDHNWSWITPDKNGNIFSDTLALDFFDDYGVDVVPAAFAGSGFYEVRPEDNIPFEIIYCFNIENRERKSIFDFDILYFQNPINNSDSSKNDNWKKLKIFSQAFDVDFLWHSSRFYKFSYNGMDFLCLFPMRESPIRK
jgi:hypothetical protein